MYRYFLLIILYMVIVATSAFSQKAHFNLIMDITKQYIETMECDPKFYLKVNKYSQYKNLYLHKLISEKPEEIFLSSVILGLLRVEESMSKLKDVTIEDTKAKIGIAFALCMFKQDWPANKN